jgi:tetratricopeptide (TPR) repeat protein
VSAAVRGGKHAAWLALDTALLGVLLFQVLAFLGEGVEDALISFRYAYNLAEGHGLVYNPGEYVEGISNPLWTVALAACYACGSTMFLAAYRLVIFCVLLSFLLLRWAGIRQFGGRTVTSRLPLLFLACFTELNASHGNLLEGASVMACLSCILAGGVVRNTCLLGVGAVLLAGSRPEGIGVALLVMVWTAFEMRAGRVERARFWRMCAGILAAICALIALRAGYYGALFPNGARIKMACARFDRYSSTLSGLYYVARYIRAVGVPMAMLALAGLAFRKVRSIVLLLLGLVAFNLLVVVQNGGDWMPQFRLLTPYAPLLAFAAVAVAASFPRRYHVRTVALTLCGVCAIAAFQFQSSRFQRGADLFAAVAHADSKLGLDTRCPEKFHFSPSLAPDDFREADDKVVMENGGLGGWIFRDSYAIEQWGLTEPRLLDIPSSAQVFGVPFGVTNFQVLATLKPTYFQLSYGNSPDQIPPSLSAMHAWHWHTLFSDFMVAMPLSQPSRNVQLGPFLAREDRLIFPQALLDYGFFCPVTDIPTIPPELSGHAGAELPTAWLRAPWTDENGRTVSAGIRMWDDLNRYSWALPMDTEHHCYRKALLDDAPVVLLLGVAPDSGIAALASVNAIDGEGQRHPVDALWLDARPSGQIISIPAYEHAGTVGPDARASEPTQTCGLVIPGAVCGPKGSLEICLDGEKAGNLLVAAYRWTKGVTPVLPVEFTRARLTQQFSYDTKTGDRARLKQTFNALDALPPDTLREAETRRGVWRAAAALRQEVLRNPKDGERYEALNKLYEEAGETRSLVHEWTYLAARLEHYPLPRVYLVHALLKAGDLDAVLRCNDAMERLFDNLTPPYLEEAGAFALAGRCDTSETLYRKAIEQDPQRNGIYEALSACYARCENLKTVAETGRASVTLDTANAKPSGPHGANRDNARADAYRTMVETEPAAYGAYEKLSDLYVKSGDLQGLIDEWRAAVAKHSDRALAQFCLGLAYDRLDRYDEAIASYRRSLALDPKAEGTSRCLAKALVSRGKQRLANGKAEDALADFRDALKLDPNYADAKEQEALARALPKRSETGADASGSAGTP